MIVLLDDFHLIIGINIFIKAKASLLLYIRGMIILGLDYLCFVSCEFISKNKLMVAMVYALQLKFGVKKGYRTFVASLLESNPGKVDAVLDCISAM